MRALYEEFLKSIDADALYRRTFELCGIELGQTTPCHIRAAEFVAEEMRKAGIPNVEKIDVVADGVTTYQDKTMPLAWDASMGRLTALSKVPSGYIPVSQRGQKHVTENVLADFERHPFHLVKGSVATPPGGIVTRVGTAQQMLAGEDVRGAMVMLEANCRAVKSVIRPILDLGALGFIADYVVGRYETPDALSWINAVTDSGNWHVIAEDRPFIGFSVTPRTGDMIRQCANSGVFKVRVESDGRRYVGVEPLVTALIPGESSKEVWVFGHLYEPLLNDDAGGISAAIEIAKALMKKGKLRHSVRLVFAMEMYGYAAYAALRGEKLKDEAIGGCNIDSICAVRDEPLVLYPTGNAKPFIGNELLKRAYESCKDALKLEYGEVTYMDDLFIGDPTVGVPSVWLLGRGRGYWHNSSQCKEDFIDRDTMLRSSALAAAFIHELADSSAVPAPPPRVTELKHTPWRDYAAKMIVGRKEPGFLYSLAKMPRYARIPIPDGMLYGTFSSVVCALDGKKDLAQAIAEAEAETGTEKKESEVKKYIDALNLFADYGYFEVVSRPEITEEEIASALKKLGVTDEDLLLVHASVSKCGYIRGGAKTLIEAVRRSCGTSLFTTFTRPYIYLGGLNRGWLYRPFDPADPDQVWTGTVGKTVLRDFPDALRSRHITHSWAGFGTLAHECLDAHGPCDPPAGETSPLAKALELGGKILYFGADLSSTTFLHYLEDAARLPFLSTAICRIKTPDGDLENVAVERHLPGDRDFYHGNGDCKFFRRAFERGLKVESVELGMGKLMLVDIRQLYDIGMKLIAEDPRVLLCDDPDCLFCRRF